MSRSDRWSRVRRAFALLTLSLSFALTGCTIRLGDFTMMSTKNVDLSRGANFERGPNRIEGRDTIHIILFIPCGRPNIKDAVDRAIQSTPGGVALMDVVWRQEGWWIPFTYGQISYVAEGTPLVDPALVPKD